MTRLSSFLNRRPSSLFSGLASGVRRPVSLFSGLASGIRRPVSLFSGLASGVWRPVSLFSGLASGVRRPASLFSGLASGVRRPASSSVRRPPAAFTLLEVMLVIGIIAILATLLFPVILGASAKARQKQAMAETRTILVAIKDYRQEYGKWPAQWQAATDTTYITNNYLVIQPLLGSNINYHDRDLNPKKKIFLNLQVNTNNNPDYAGNYLDPWGIPYVICMDENEDNNLSIMWPSNSFPPYVASNTSGREIGSTNINLTNYPVANVDAGVASLGGTPNTLPWNTWTEMP